MAEVQEEAISDACIDASNAHADELCESLIDQFDSMQEEGLDPVSVVFALWVSFTHLLVEVGWTPEELVKEVQYHGHTDVAGHA